MSDNFLFGHACGMVWTFHSVFALLGTCPDGIDENESLACAEIVCDLVRSERDPSGAEMKRICDHGSKLLRFIDDKAKANRAMGEEEDA